MPSPKMDAAYFAVTRAGNGSLTADELVAKLATLIAGQPAGTGGEYCEYQMYGKAMYRVRM